MNWVKASSGYGFVKQTDGKYSYQGATEADMQLMRSSCSEKVQVKAAGGVCDLGGTRCGATATAATPRPAKARATLKSRPNTLIIQ